MYVCIVYIYVYALLIGRGAASRVEHGPVLTCCVGGFGWLALGGCAAPALESRERALASTETKRTGRDARLPGCPAPALACVYLVLSGSVVRVRVRMCVRWMTSQAPARCWLSGWLSELWLRSLSCFFFFFFFFFSFFLFFLFSFFLLADPQAGSEFSKDGNRACGTRR
ncbi:hypothetical protein DFH11DRAFT_728157 [Phellopilus nigrolimitatus]|nr:hypothetical protein DFH11DRAFT_728157 [Phellopilus nigrolimitatus]